MDRNILKRKCFDFRSELSCFVSIVTCLCVGQEKEFMERSDMCAVGQVEVDPSFLDKNASVWTVDQQVWSYGKFLNVGHKA